MDLGGKLSPKPIIDTKEVPICTNKQTALPISTDASKERPKDWDPKMQIPKMGDIIDLRGEELTILTNQGESRTVSRRIIVDKNSILSLQSMLSQKPQE